VLAIAVLSVRLSVRLSHGWISCTTYCTKNFRQIEANGVWAKTKAAANLQPVQPVIMFTGGAQREPKRAKWNLDSESSSSDEDSDLKDKKDERTSDSSLSEDEDEALSDSEDSDDTNPFTKVSNSDDDDGTVFICFLIYLFMYKTKKISVWNDSLYSHKTVVAWRSW